MEKKKERYVEFERLIPGRIQWGVLDRKEKRLVEVSGLEVKYPEAWAKEHARKLNERD